MPNQDERLSPPPAGRPAAAVADRPQPALPADPADADGDEHGPLHARYYRPFLLLVFLAAVATVGGLLWPFRHAVILAAILALLLAPLRRRMEAALKGSRYLTAALLTAATLVFIVLPAAVLAAVMTSKAGALLVEGVQWWSEGGVASLLDRLQAVALPDWVQGLLDMIPIDSQGLKVSLLGAAGAAGRQLLAMGRGLAGQMAGFAAQTVMLVLFLFYFLSQAEQVVRGLRRLSPLRRSQEQELTERLKTVTRSILVGGAAAGLSQGLATMLGLWLVGIDPLFWGFVALLASLIPVVGTTLIHVPAIVYLLSLGAMGKAVFLTLWWLVVVSTVDNVVRPFFIRDGAQLPLLLIFVAIVGGVLLFGPLGLIYGPVSMSLCLVVFQLFVEAQTRPDP
ncbi:MAG TPA: AI-2E family transporter [Solidesulfovibrio magneticus]|nr:AI-2E family transporter [Solidesulfovibrio magneticus]